MATHRMYGSKAKLFHFLLLYDSFILHDVDSRDYIHWYLLEELCMDSACLVSTVVFIQFNLYINISINIINWNI